MAAFQAFIAFDTLNVITSLERSRIKANIDTSVLSVFTKVFSELKHEHKFRQKVLEKYLDATDFDDKLMIKPIQRLLTALKLEKENEKKIGFKLEFIIHSILKVLRMCKPMATFTFTKKLNKIEFYLKKKQFLVINE